MSTYVTRRTQTSQTSPIDRPAQSLIGIVHFIKLICREARLEPLATVLRTLKFPLQGSHPACGICGPPWELWPVRGNIGRFAEI